MGVRNTIAHVTQLVTVDADDPRDGCWRWGQWHDGGGYGRVDLAGSRCAVHRLLYEVVVGPVPEDMVLDHLCRNRWCVNPRHVEPVTNHENILRGIVPSANRAVCKNGLHDITTPGSIYVDSDGTDRCRECRLESKRRYNRRAKRRSPAFA